MTALAAGLHTDISHADYHADPCAAPSLSHSLARFIINRTPHHAMQHHPKFGAKPMKKSTALDFGNVGHALVLGKGAKFVVLDFDDFKKKAAQEARDLAIAEGKVPVLTAMFEQAQAMVPAGRAALEDALGARLDDCYIEAVVVAQDPVTKCWRRSMIDAMTKDMRTMVDYKTADDAGPRAFERAVRAYGYDTQDAFYRRVVELAAGDAERTYTFVVQEKEYPDVVTFNQIDGDLLAVAQHKISKAVAAWDTCLQSQEWPAYGRAMNLVSARAYEIEEAMVEGAADV